MSMQNTRERILDTAEKLFAKHGFDSVSVRMITTKAKVNQASINYYFGSKEALIRAVFSRHFIPINEKRLQMLSECESSAGTQSPDLTKIIQAFIIPPIQASAEKRKNRGELLVLMGKMHTESAVLKMSIKEIFSEVMDKFQNALMKALPNLSSDEIFCRFVFMIGTMMSLLLGASGVHADTSKPLDDAHIEMLTHRLTVFLAAGMAAPAADLREGITHV